VLHNKHLSINTTICLCNNNNHNLHVYHITTGGDCLPVGVLHTKLILYIIITIYTVINKRLYYEYV